MACVWDIQGVSNLTDEQFEFYAISAVFVFDSCHLTGMKLTLDKLIMEQYKIQPHVITFETFYQNRSLIRSMSNNFATETN